LYNESIKATSETSGVKVTGRVGYWEDLSARTATDTEGHQVYVEGQGKEIDKTAGGHKYCLV
jgi:hypothetical protein